MEFDGDGIMFITNEEKNNLITKCRILSAIIIIVFALLSMSACEKSDITNSEESSNIIESNSVTTDLSGEYSQLLAEGTDAQQNHYMLVGNITENHNGLTAEMGVIKNGQWLVPMTSSIPFIGDNGQLIDGLGGVDTSLSLYQIQVGGLFKYVGSGVFFYNNTFYNSENNLSFTTNSYACNYSYPNYEDENVKDTGEHIVMIRDDAKSPFVVYALDTLTMQAKELSFLTNLEDNSWDLHICPFSEGLFAVIGSWGDAGNDYSPAVASYNGFYDLNGNRVIDLSSYKIHRLYETNAYIPENHPVFVNGNANLVVINEAGSLFTLTIDKAGSVVSERRGLS